MRARGVPFELNYLIVAPTQKGWRPLVIALFNHEFSQNDVGCKRQILSFNGCPTFCPPAPVIRVVSLPVLSKQAWQPASWGTASVASEYCTYRHTRYVPLPICPGYHNFFRSLLITIYIRCKRKCYTGPRPVGRFQIVFFFPVQYLWRLFQFENNRSWRSYCYPVSFVFDNVRFEMSAPRPVFLTWVFLWIFSVTPPDTTLTL